jgi:hypothetical protein
MDAFRQSSSVKILIVAFASSSLLAADKFVVGGDPGATALVQLRNAVPGLEILAGPLPDHRAAAPAVNSSTTQNVPFSAAKIRKLREETAKVTQVPPDGPNGWSKSTMDPNKVLELFKPLRLRKGYVLRAYQFKAEGNGNGVVWAMPADAEFPEPKDCPILENHLLKAPKPFEALDDVMEAIEGDGTPWSYLAASLLRRELSEFGASWHGCNWSLHFVLDEDPWMADPPNPDEPALDRPTTKALEWTWLDEAPKDWRPRVTGDEDRVTVTLYTYCGLETQRLFRYTDTYKPGKLRAKVQEKVIASDGPGYMP